MISNLTLQIKNFYSYLDSGVINLDGKIILSGMDENGTSNGTGKSTILRALELFLSEDYKDYTKTDIKSITNTKAKRGGYIDITVKCLIDGEPFEANMNGKDYFKLTGDEYKLNKFRQELTGSIMTQGLVDNIADFEKRSELDNYIDKFYNTKEIVTKLKDFEASTTSKIQNSLDKAKVDYNTKLNNYNYLINRISVLGENLKMYEQFEGLDVKALEKEISLGTLRLKDLTKNYYLEKQHYNNAISQLNYTIASNSKQEEILRQKEDYIRSQTAKNRTEYLNSLEYQVKRAVREYNNAKVNAKPSEMVSIEDLEKINKLVGSQEFNYGVTYNEVILKSRSNQSEIESICKSTEYVEVAFIDSHSKPNGYYVSYDENLNIAKNIPSDMTLDLSNIKMKAVDTSYYDNQLSKEVDIEDAKKKLQEWQHKYNTLLQEEVEYTKLNAELKEAQNKINNYNTYISYKEELANLLTKQSQANTETVLANAEVEKFEFNISELHKIIDSVSKFAGEELRAEFGTKLARISTILLEDIFGLKGTITLESNGTKTNFKFDEGAGELSFKGLSGGQRQKIKICINLAMLLFFYKDRQYIFLDEVFQNLDEPSKQRLIQYVTKELKVKNVLLIQHDNLKFEGFRELIVHRGKDLNSVVKEVNNNEI